MPLATHAAADAWSAQLADALNQPDDGLPTAFPRSNRWESAARARAIAVALARAADSCHRQTADDLSTGFPRSESQQLRPQLSEGGGQGRIAGLLLGNLRVGVPHGAGVATAEKA